MGHRTLQDFIKILVPEGAMNAQPCLISREADVNKMQQLAVVTLFSEKPNKKPEG